MNAWPRSVEGKMVAAAVMADPLFHDPIGQQPREAFDIVYLVLVVADEEFQVVEYYAAQERRVSDAGTYESFEEAVEYATHCAIEPRE